MRAPVGWSDGDRGRKAEHFSENRVSPKTLERLLGCHAVNTNVPEAGKSFIFMSHVAVQRTLFSTEPAILHDKNE